MRVHIVAGLDVTGGNAYLLAVFVDVPSGADVGDGYLVVYRRVVPGGHGLQSAVGEAVLHRVPGPDGAGDGDAGVPVVYMYSVYSAHMPCLSAGPQATRHFRFHNQNYTVPRF